MADYEFYLVEKKPPVAYVYLNRPQKYNAMNAPAWKESVPIFEDLDRDGDINAVILSGKGKCFCTGIDLMGMAAELPEFGIKEQLGALKWAFIPKLLALQDAISCIERCRKPVIAAIHGHCIGGGLDMATACDIRLCSRDASFSLREAAVGIVADVGVLQRIPLIVGQGVARELALTARYIDSARAREILLVNEVYESHEALMQGAEKMAIEISENSPLAVQATKEVLNFCVGKTVEDGLKYVAAISSNIIPSNDLFEALNAMIEKRKPKFTGK